MFSLYEDERSTYFLTLKIFEMTENYLTDMNQPEKTKKAIRGFAAMSPEKQKEIASKGGRAAHEQGVAHEWNSDEAKAAGKKGGQARGKSSQDTVQ